MLFKEGEYMRKNPYSGKFVVLEGGEGVGKTTQQEFLVETLERTGYKIFPTKEPTEESVFGKLVRDLYTHTFQQKSFSAMLNRYLNTAECIEAYLDMPDTAAWWRQRFQNIAEELREGNLENLPLFLQLGMIFDRREHRKKEAVILSGGTHLIGDRDLLSTLAYGAGEGLDWRELLQAHSDILGELFFMPDLIMILNVSVSEGLKRTLEKQKGKKERQDDAGLQQKIKKAYHEITEDAGIQKHCRIVAIDGIQEKKAVHQTIMDIVKPLLDQSA